ncbi:hypothetical protein ALC60_07939 [Trachymyrmex zeteki]|uniref:Uncharacterized protein n=1 Tax=Mycetomoellerius zeteki TaxID=64791 RepID=A0A151WZ97_9HYME|nr:hypothetical protein ALC60_07939 [Trachymyrmex zeteki]
MPVMDEQDAPIRWRRWWRRIGETITSLFQPRAGYYSDGEINAEGSIRLFKPEGSFRSCKKRFKTPAMNADDPTRCPNIWIPQHVRSEREEHSGEGPDEHTPRAGEASIVTSMFNEISRASV